eukprot:4974883-Amphidinium_carterae.1
MEQIEIDETIDALQDRVSEDVMAQVIRVVDQQIVPSKWTSPDLQQSQEGLETSRRSIQVPVQNQLRVLVSPRSENNTAEPTSQLERVLDQGNIPEQQQIAQILVQPIAQRNVPVVLQEDTAGTPMVDEFPAPQGGWVTIDLANVQRLRTTEQGDPPPPQIVQESILTAPLQRTIPQGLQPDLASVFVNADQMVAAYEKKPRVFPTRQIQGPSVAPNTVSLTTPYSFSEWNTEQY